MEVTPFLLNGRWVTTDSTAPVQNPHTGEAIAQVCQADRSHLDEAIAGAERAFRDHRAMPRHQRATLLTQVAAGLAADKHELSRLIATEAGKPLQFAAGEVDRAISTFTVAAEEAKRLSGEWLPTDWSPAGEGYLAVTKRVPLGPIAAFAPFNFPLNLVAHKIAPCLASGNTMVLKPPPQAPQTSLRLGRILVEAGVPPGAINILPCPVPVAEALVADPRIQFVTFTGSAKVGWHLKTSAGKKGVLLELGGNAAAIVHVDADLGWAAYRLALGAFAYAGQICISVQRILVHEALYERFVEQFLLDVDALQVGDPLDEKTVVGPLIDASAADRVERWAREAVAAGAKSLTPISRAGNVIAPIVLTHTSPAMAVSCEEVFGPVVTLAPYRSFQEAITTVNDSRYGLQAGVFTHDYRKAFEAFEGLDVGGVIINDYPTFRVDHTPYGGMKDSGLGREGVKYAMDAMTQIKTAIFRTGMTI
ncbi:MAG: aldehyde dehydrogenase family protein [Nitrospirae bacterium]|nr:aldehyde dehydrogenase family protein [Nitrospirota bacterium]